MMKPTRSKPTQNKTGKKQEGTEKCPFCGKNIRVGAIWCVYCGKDIKYNLETLIRNKNSKKFKKNLVVIISFIVSFSFVLLLGYLFWGKWSSTNRTQTDKGQTKGDVSVKYMNTDIFIWASNWDADPEYGGIKFNVSLKNKRGETIKALGGFFFKLYRMNYNAINQKGPLITTWDIFENMDKNLWKKPEGRYHWKLEWEREPDCNICILETVFTNQYKLKYKTRSVVFLREKIGR